MKKCENLQAYCSLNPNCALDIVKENCPKTCNICKEFSVVQKIQEGKTFYVRNCRSIHLSHIIFLYFHTDLQLFFFVFFSLSKTTENEDDVNESDGSGEGGKKWQQIKKSLCPSFY